MKVRFHLYNCQCRSRQDDKEEEKLVTCDNINVDKVTLDDFEFELLLGKGRGG